MDDDQFHGNLNVQGGNPEPAAEATPSAESESEMSRRMNEILGSFDDGIATERAISSGNGKVVQGTAVRAEAPKPDFIANNGQEQIAAPVQTQAAPNTFNAAPAEVAQSVAFDVTPGATPVMTGVPRSNIEQAAAEQAARDAVAAEKNNKVDPKIMIGIVLAIIVIAVSSVFIVMGLNKPKRNGGGSGSAETSDNNGDNGNGGEEKVVETQRIGTAEHGYVTVPKDWIRYTAVSASEFAYSNEDKTIVVSLTSSAASDIANAKTRADMYLMVAKSDKTASNPELKTFKIGDIDAYEVYCYRTDVKKWEFIFVFDGADNRIHVISISANDNTADEIQSIPQSWSLNQNSEDKKTSDDSETDEDNKASGEAEASESKEPSGDTETSGGETAE